MPKYALEQRGQAAILNLRKEKFKKGHPFMINLPSLPAHQCYLEYADGKIELVTLTKSRLDFEVLSVLPYSEAEQLRLSLGLKK